MEYIKEFKDYIENTQLNEEHIRLRTLTLKSKLGFGKYHDYTVKDIIIKEVNYLVWAYFNMDMISFMDDVLDEIDIPMEYRIEKPGKNVDMFKKYKDSRRVDFNSLSEEEKLEIIKKRSHNKKQHKIYNINKRISNNFNFSKGKMQNRNHGKMK